MMETVTIKKLSIEDIYDNFIKRYESGHFTEGVCEWNGDDALMSPRSFAHAFKKECEEHGYRYDQYKHGRRNRRVVPIAYWPFGK